MYLHGTVGADDEGRWLREFAQEQGVLVDHVQVDPDGRTGSAWITVAADGANTVIVDPGANQATAFDAAVPLSPADVVVAQLEVPEAAVADLFRSAGAAGARSIFNPSPVGAGRDLAAEASIVVLNEHELSELSGASLSADHGPEAVEQMAASREAIRPNRGGHTRRSGSDGRRARRHRGRPGPDGARRRHHGRGRLLSRGPGGVARRWPRLSRCAPPQPIVPPRDPSRGPGPHRPCRAPPRSGLETRTTMPMVTS